MTLSSANIWLEDHLDKFDDKGTIPPLNRDILVPQILVLKRKKKIVSPRRKFFRPILCLT